MKRLFASAIAILAITFVAFSAAPKEPIKVLAIGNSFSVDAMEQELHSVFEGCGDQILIGNLYIGGCSIETHVMNMRGDLPNYSYRRISLEGERTVREGAKLSEAIKDEQWDVVTVQQASHFSGQPETYVLLPELVAWIHENAPQAKIYFHETWAYSPTSSHGGFVNYGRDQMTMFNAILAAVKPAVEDNNLDAVIPSGTAIQNARTTSLGDDLTRDGFHLDYRIGRYIASCTWYEVLTGRSVTRCKYVPKDVKKAEAKLAQKSAHAAVRHPYSISKVR